MALSIAMLASAAVVVFYTQVKESSGDSAMREKIGSLQAVVESLYTAQGACPTLANVQQAWYAKRPDALKSPWGGDIYDMSPLQTGGIRAGVTGGALIAGTEQGAVESNVGVGALYYYYVVNAAYPNAPNAIATAALYDVTKGATVSITGYAVAGLKHNGWRHFMVTSGR
ncbi:MAG TPA: hypothetical protein V6D05_02860 [Stenomitos sp.]